MSAYYDLYETPSPNGKGDKKSLHARICPKATYTKKEFVERVATFQHLPKNIIGAALDACIDELCDLLANGNIVELGELGFFSTSLKCTQETDDEKKKIRSESVQFQNVHLRISSTFRKRIRQAMKLGKDTLTDKEIEESKDHRRNEKGKADAVPAKERMHYQERVYPTDRADEACSYRRAERVRQARHPAPPGDKQVYSLHQARRYAGGEKL